MSGVNKIRRWAKREVKAIIVRRYRAVNAQVAARQNGEAVVEYRTRDVAIREADEKSRTIWGAILAYIFGINKWFVLIVILPSTISAIYFFGIAADLYMSEARFVVRSTTQKQTSALSSVLATAGLQQNNNTDSDSVMSFLSSRDAVKALEKHDHLREVFHRPESDFFTRFPSPWSNGSFEKLFTHYQRYVYVVDNSTGILVLQVKAYRAHDAQNIAQALIRYSEDLVNDMNNRAQADAVRQAKSDLDDAQKNIVAVQQRLTQFRIQQRMLDPALTSTGLNGMLGSLMSARLTAATQLAELTKVSPNSPAIPSLKAHIATLDSQVNAETDKLTGSTASVVGKFGDYSQLNLELSQATTTLTGATAALVSARSDALRRGTYLEHIAEPNLPDYPLFPYRLADFAFTLAASLVVYGICWLLIAGVREHA